MRAHNVLARSSARLYNSFNRSENLRGVIIFHGFGGERAVICVYSAALQIYCGNKTILPFVLLNNQRRQASKKYTG